MKMLSGLWITMLFLGAASMGGPSSPASSVQVSVIAVRSGIGGTPLSPAGLVVRVADFDGTNDTYSWPSGEPPDPDSLNSLKVCLENLRWVVRVADPDQVSQPHFIHTAAMQCFESSGLPAYVNTREPDAREYEVQLSTGNLNASKPPDPGTRLSASGGPFLGMHRRIQSDRTDPLTVVKDVRGCRDEAVADGVFTNSTLSSAPDSVGWQMNHYESSIRPMVERFDRCLKKRSYTVQPLEEAGVHRKP